MMGEFARLRFFGVVMLFCTVFGARAWGAPVAAKPQYDMRFMIQQNPDFSTYPGFDGVLWLKQFDYRPAPRGGVERTSTWVLLGRKGIDPQWLSWSIPVPAGGEMEFLEASVHLPGTAQKLRDVPSFDRAQGSATVRSVDFDDLPDEFILVVAYREVFPDRLTLDDLVWVGEELPVWETLVTATVPAGQSFYATSKPELKPKIGKAENKDYLLYTWRAVNTPGEPHFFLRASERPFVAFGMREGEETAARSLKARQGTLIPSRPDGARSLTSKRGVSKTQALLAWLFRQPTLVVPEGSTREIPPEAPWTREEKVLLAHTWLRQEGQDVRILWGLPYRPSAETPVGAFSAIEPVLEVLPVDPQKGEPFLVDMRISPQWGENSPFLWGRTVYAVGDEGKLMERKVASSAASENRLSLLFDLSLNRDGVLSGTLKVRLRNAWGKFLLPTDPTSDDLKLLLHEFFPNLPRYRDVTFKKTNDGGEIYVALPDQQMIKGTKGRNILVTWPSFIPQWLGGLNGGVPYALRFPFVLDAKITMAMPEGTENVMLPESIERGMGKMRYMHSYKLSRKKVVTAEARLTLATVKIDEPAAADLKTVLQGWYLLMTQNLPVQLKLPK